MKEVRKSGTDTCGRLSSADAAHRAAELVAAQRRGIRRYAFPQAPNEVAAEHLLIISSTTAKLQHEWVGVALAKRFDWVRSLSWHSRRR